MAVTTVEEMHAWYMGDGRRSLGSVAREFGVGEEEVRTAFVDSGLELKTAKPLYGAAKKRAKTNSDKEHEAPKPERDEHPLDVGPVPTPAELVVTGARNLIEVIEEEILRLTHAREALMALLPDEEQ